MAVSGHAESLRKRYAKSLGNRVAVVPRARGPESVELGNALMERMFCGYACFDPTPSQPRAMNRSAGHVDQ